MDKKSLEKIQEVFIERYDHIPLKIPDTDLVNRTKGSMRCENNRIFYVFGEDRGREYFEYYEHYEYGGGRHGKIYEDGEWVSLPNLTLKIFYDPKISGDKERKETEYNNTLDDLKAKGMFSPGLDPDTLAIQSYIVITNTKYYRVDSGIVFRCQTLESGHQSHYFYGPGDEWLQLSRCHKFDSPDYTPIREEEAEHLIQICRDRYLKSRTKGKLHEEEVS